MVFKKTNSKSKSVSSKKKLAEILRVLNILKYQYGHDIFGEFLEKPNDVRIEYSKKTAKMKNVYYQNKRFLTYKPTVGIFTLSLDACRYLLEKTEPPRLRVIIMDEIKEYIKKGSSVFSKHILGIDNNLRPGLDVIVTDPNDALVAVGKLSISPYLYPNTDSGMAVSIRKSVNK
ncbi:MAG: PUA domain-containing protein [Promethearchaeota archaeon]